MNNTQTLAVAIAIALQISVCNLMLVNAGVAPYESTLTTNPSSINSNRQQQQQQQLAIQASSQNSLSNKNRNDISSSHLTKDAASIKLDPLTPEPSVTSMHQVWTATSSNSNEELSPEIISKLRQGLPFLAAYAMRPRLVGMSSSDSAPLVASPVLGGSTVNFVDKTLIEPSASSSSRRSIRSRAAKLSPLNDFDELKVETTSTARAEHKHNQKTTLRNRNNNGAATKVLTKRKSSINQPKAKKSENVLVKHKQTNNNNNKLIRNKQVKQTKRRKSSKLKSNNSQSLFKRRALRRRNLKTSRKATDWLRSQRNKQKANNKANAAKQRKKFRAKMKNMFIRGARLTNDSTIKSKTIPKDNNKTPFFSSRIPNNRIPDEREKTAVKDNKASPKFDVDEDTRGDENDDEDYDVDVDNENQTRNPTSNRKTRNDSNSETDGESANDKKPLRPNNDNDEKKDTDVVDNDDEDDGADDANEEDDYDSIGSHDKDHDDSDTVTIEPKFDGVDNNPSPEDDVDETTTTTTAKPSDKNTPLDDVGEPELGKKRPSSSDDDTSEQDIDDDANGITSDTNIPKINATRDDSTRDRKQGGKSKVVPGVEFADEANASVDSDVGRKRNSGNNSTTKPSIVDGNNVDYHDNNDENDDGVDSSIENSKRKSQGNKRTSSNDSKPVFPNENRNDESDSTSADSDDKRTNDDESRFVRPKSPPVASKNADDETISGSVDYLDNNDSNAGSSSNSSLGNTNNKPKVNTNFNSNANRDFNTNQDDCHDHDNHHDHHKSIKWLQDAIRGEPNIDYPIMSEANNATGFDCSKMKFPGYYADVETRCQVFHVCQQDGRQSSFLCPNGTIFNQITASCVWWDTFKCEDAPKYYDNNSKLYKGPNTVLNNSFNSKTNVERSPGSFTNDDAENNVQIKFSEMDINDTNDDIEDKDSRSTTATLLNRNKRERIPRHITNDENLRSNEAADWPIVGF